ELVKPMFFWSWTASPVMPVGIVKSSRALATTPSWCFAWTSRWSRSPATVLPSTSLRVREVAAEVGLEPEGLGVPAVLERIDVAVHEHVVALVDAPEVGAHPWRRAVDRDPGRATESSHVRVADQRLAELSLDLVGAARAGVLARADGQRNLGIAGLGRRADHPAVQRGRVAAPDLGDRSGRERDGEVLALGHVDGRKVLGPAVLVTGIAA